MSWVKLDDGFHSNPKVRKAGNAGAGVYARALSWCGAYYTDGFISRADAAFIGKTAELNRVTDAELWEEISPGEKRTVTDRRDSGNRPLPDVILSFDTYGFFISDYLQGNPTKAEVEAARAKRRAAGSKGGEATAVANAVANAEADAQANGQHSPSPAQPSPVTEKPDFSVMEACNLLAESVTDADARTAGTFARQVEALNLIDAGYVVRLAKELRGGDKGAGFAVNALRREQARRMVSGMTLKSIDGRAA
jgi:hypothetical protein